MTNVLAITGKRTLWLVADRRLSVGARVVRDDAKKITVLETLDGVALLGYAGLGATALGTEPSDWMVAVLCGRHMPIERSLGAIAAAMQDQLPRHLRGLRSGVHFVIAPAFVAGIPKLFSISLALQPDGSSRFRYANHECRAPSGAQWPPPFAFAGSGAAALLEERGWQRDLLRLVHAHDDGKIAPLAVADRLAALNYGVSRHEPSVGPDCIVAWRHPVQGGGHQYYSGLKRAPRSDALPIVSRGNDLGAIFAAVWPFAGQHAGEQPNIGAMNAALAKVPTEPDEKLR